MNEVYADSGLGKWFGSGKKGGAGGGGWDRYNTKGERIGKCGDKSSGEGKPKCLSKDKARKMSKKERGNAVRRKRKSDPSTDRPGTGNKPINVSNRINKEHTMLSFRQFISEKNVPTDPSKWAASKAAAKAKFDVYPSAYANAWASKNYKSKGGGWKKANESVEVDEAHEVTYKPAGDRESRLIDNAVEGSSMRKHLHSSEKGSGGKWKLKFKSKRGYKNFAVNYPGTYTHSPNKSNESVEVEEAKIIDSGSVTYQAKDRKEYQKLYGAAMNAMNNKMTVRGGMVSDRSKLTVKINFKDEKTRKKFEKGFGITESVELGEQKKNCGCGKDPCITYGKKNEALDHEDKPLLKKIIKKLKGASQAHAGQAKDLEKAMKESAAWQRKEGKNKEGGLNAAGRKSYERENPGSDLKAPVSASQAKKSKGGKAAKRRRSFCARMGGMPGPMKKPNGEPTRKALALRKWDC